MSTSKKLSPTRSRPGTSCRPPDNCRLRAEGLEVDPGNAQCDEMVSVASERARLGRFGEAVAADFLERRGGRVLARNVEAAGGEIDLIVDFGSETAAVEVRSSRRQREDLLVTASKQAQVRRVAASLEPPVFRVDVITVLLDKAGVRVRWHPRV